MFATLAPMGWTNPPIPWSELERRLSGRPYNADGGDSPAWSNQRGEYRPPAVPRRTATVAYAELHCHSNFSFLDGASHPEELVEEAAQDIFTSTVTFGDVEPRRVTGFQAGVVGVLVGLGLAMCLALT